MVGWCWWLVWECFWEGFVFGVLCVVGVGGWFWCCVWSVWWICLFVCVGVCFVVLGFVVRWFVLGLGWKGCWGGCWLVIFWWSCWGLGLLVWKFIVCVEFLIKRYYDLLIFVLVILLEWNLFWEYIVCILEIWCILMFVLWWVIFFWWWIGLCRLCWCGNGFWLFCVWFFVLVVFCILVV